MLVKTKSIVLHYVKFSENSIIAQLYTEKFGRQSFIVSSIHGKRAKIPIAFFHSLSLLEIEAYIKDNREVHRLKEVSQHRYAHELASDIKKNSLALFLAEIIYRTIREHEPNPGLFKFLEHSIEFLDSQSTGIINFHLMFLIHFSRYLGIYSPTLDIDLWQKSIPGNNSPEVVKSSENTIIFFANHRYEDLPEISINKDLRNNLLVYLLNYYYYHLEGMGKIKSVKVLHELMY